MLRKLVPLLAAGVLTSCAGGNGPVGVWLLEIGYLEGDDPVRTINHNYLNAVPEVDEPDDSGWTYVDTTEYSPAILFGEIFELDGETTDYVLVVQDMVLPGAEQEDGSLAFTWTAFRHDTQSETHTTGYDYTVTESEDLTYAAALVLDKDVGTGTLDLTYVDTLAWSESDFWDVGETGINSGQTPAEAYLDSTQAEGFVANRPDLTDCMATPCTLSRVSDGFGSAAVKATRTGVERGDFESVEHAGLAPGDGGPIGNPTR